MQIVVNHLTRMQPGYICVAGLDERGQHIRPVLEYSRLRSRLLRRSGGPFDIGTVVDLGRTRATPNPPEIEDHVFEESVARYAGDVDPVDLWNRLQEVTRPTLRDIFGEALIHRGRTCAVDVGSGLASLGCLVPQQVSLATDSYGTLRLSVSDTDISVSLPVTDLRFYEDDFKTIREPVVVNVSSRLRRGVESILSVGLARAWRRPDDTEPRHWLQVNNLHLADNPLWRHQDG